MTYKITLKKQIKCKYCNGLRYHNFDHQKSDKDITVEYYCTKCDGSGKTSKNVSMPLSSLKSLLNK